jgi:hypothetical protein
MTTMNANCDADSGVIVRRGVQMDVRSWLQQRTLNQTRPFTQVIASAVGARAVGALAVGAGAVGALAIGRLAIGRAVIRSLQIEDLEVGHLKVRELEVLQETRPV